MDHADFPWQHLGTLLVEEGLVARSDLDSALAEQRRTGRLLGQILVQQGVMSGTALARALARQHGVELRQANGAVAEQVVGLGEAPASEAPTRWDRPWKPLGKLLVENGVISPGALLDALVEKGDHPDRRLGEILVRHGHVSGAAGQPSYKVYAVEHVLGSDRRTVLYEGPNLLDAADFACDYVDRTEPHAVEIDRHDANGLETVWTYSRQRAAAEASESKRLVDTFGFDPARWDVRT